jgi:hypothetical protein
MAVSRKQLRQAIIEELDGGCVGTVDSATNTTLTDADLADRGQDTYAAGSTWLKITSGAGVGQVRATELFAADSGQFTLKRAWTTVPSPSDEYELHTLVHPDRLDEAINRGLVSLPYDVEQEITVVDDALNYSLAAYTWLANPRQVWGVKVRYGDEANEYEYLPAPGWTVRNNAGAMTLDRRYPGSASSKLYLCAVRYYDELASDAATTGCPQEWAVAAAAVELYRYLARQSNDPAASVFQQRETVALGRLGSLNRKYVPRHTGRIIGPYMVRGYSGAREDYDGRW